MPTSTLPRRGSATPVAPVSKNGTCPNCGVERQGPYCSACGQHAIAGERLTLRTLWSEFSRRFLHFEQGLLLTIREMMTDPGGLIKRYISGQRRRYVNPLGFLVMAVAFSLTVRALSGYEERMLAQTLDASLTVDQGMTISTLMQDFMRWSLEHLSILTVLVCVFMAVFMRLFLGRTRMSIPEGLVFGLFCYGQVVIIGTLLEVPYIFAPGLPYDVNVWMFMEWGLLLGFATLAAYQLFEKRVQPMLLTVLSLVGGYLAYYAVQIVAMVGFIVFFLLSSGDKAWNLHEAVAQNRPAVAEALLNDGADPNATTGQTPLHVAAEQGRTEMVQLLLAKGAAYDRPDAAGRTPLLIALHFRQDEAARHLLDAGTDVNRADTSGTTPLMAAVSNKHEAFTRRMLDLGADPNAIRPNHPQATALMIAARKRRGGGPLVALLLAHGADPALTNADGQTALDLARNGESRARLREALGRE